MSGERKERVCGVENLFIWIAIQSTRPQECLSLLWLDSDVERGERCLSSFFHVREIEEEGEDAWTTRELAVLASIVVVDSVPLSYLVLQHLKGLVVFLIKFIDYMLTGFYQANKRERRMIRSLPKARP